MRSIAQRPISRLLASWLPALLLLASAGLARAAKSPLEGAPAVRHRFELRENRFAIGPSVAFSLNRSLRHAILFGAKLEYHITDYLSIGADVGYGIGLDTGLTGELEDNFDRRGLSGQWAEKADRFADIKLQGDARLVFTPFAGKMGVFGKLFFAYDFFAFAGFGFAMTQNNTDAQGAEGQDYDAANEGFRPGFAWGFGMRMFFTRWMAFGFEVKDLLFADNESGEDVTRGLTDEELAANGGAGAILVNGDDQVFGNHFFIGLSFTFFLPPTPRISD
jgi:outer membrane beta-barrel protein